MNQERKRKEIADAMYDHRFVTVNLTDGRTFNGRISSMSDISCIIAFTPRNGSRLRFDLIESVKIQ